MPFVLTIAEGKGRGQRFSFETADVTIGRGTENDVVLNDAGVSRTHARIQRAGESWLLVDNGSSNGTELNGATIEKPSALRSGDRIGVGPVTFEFAAQVQAAPETRISSMPVEARSVAPRAGAQVKAPTGVLAVWAGLPLAARIGSGAALALLVVAFARRAVSSKEGRGLSCPDTVAVDDDVAGFSFGSGEVDVDCGGKVVFGFNVPPKTRALFHYLALHVSQPAELDLRLNGKHVSWAKVAGARGETQVVPLPAELLATDGRNFVVFSQSQKGKEWSVGKVRVELLAITPGDLTAARADYNRGRRKLEERRIAPRNLYDAWKAFTSARRQMEGLSPRPPLCDEVAQLIKDSERDLDKECGRLLFTANRFEKYGQDDRAQQTYRDVLLHFPGEDPTGCRKKAQENIVSAQTAEAGE